jgi:hypothetical protein
MGKKIPLYKSKMFDIKKSAETAFGKTGLYLFTLLLIYLGSVFYVIASFFHLKMGNNWTFLKAYSIAIPVVLVEYIFSLNGNHLANHSLGIDPIQILIITICFYFVNLWVFNYFVLKNTTKSVWRELLAFALIVVAFSITNVIKVV